MTSPTVQAEPLYIGDRYIKVKFYAAPRNPGDPSTIVGTLTLMPDEDVLVLDALRGPKGDMGPTAPFWDPQWDSTITVPGDLPTNLGAGDKGKAWYISGYWHIWTGNFWKILLGSIPGPPGITPNISFSAEQIEAPPGGPYGPIVVNESGTLESPNFHMLIPGIIGPEGPSTQIRNAPDYDDEVGILDGQTIVWNETTAKFTPGDPAQQAMTWITMPEYSFGPAGTFSAVRTVVGSFPIPAQPEAYYPKVGGHLRWKRSGLFNSAQVEVEVRIENEGNNSPETGSLIGRALYDPSTLDAETIAHIHAHHSDITDPSRSISPSTNVGRVSAGQAVRVYVILFRSGGAGSYVYATAGSYLSYEMFPVS